MSQSIRELKEKSVETQNVVSFYFSRMRSKVIASTILLLQQISVVYQKREAVDLQKRCLRPALEFIVLINNFYFYIFLFMVFG